MNASWNSGWFSHDDERRKLFRFGEITAEADNLTVAHDFVDGLDPMTTPFPAPDYMPPRAVTGLRVSTNHKGRFHRYRLEWTVGIVEAIEDFYQGTRER